MAYGSPTYTGSHGCEAVEECAVGVLRSLGEGGLASVGSTEVTKGTTAVKPWGSTNRSGVLYGQKSVDPALMRIGLNIVRRCSRPLNRNINEH